MSDVINALKDNKVAIGTGVASLALGTVVGVVAYKRYKKKKKSKSKRSRNKSRKKYSYSHNKSKSRKSKRRYPYTAGKRKDTSHRRIRFTKRGQPYVILKSGKARFIKMKSVKNSRKRSGGRY